MKFWINLTMTPLWIQDNKGVFILLNISAKIWRIEFKLFEATSHKGPVEEVWRKDLLSSIVWDCPFNGLFYTPCHSIIQWLVLIPAAAGTTPPTHSYSSCSFSDITRAAVMQLSCWNAAAVQDNEAVNSSMLVWLRAACTAVLLFSCPIVQLSYCSAVLLYSGPIVQLSYCTAEQLYTTSMCASTFLSCTN